MRINFDGRFADINRAINSYRTNAQSGSTIGSLQEPEKASLNLDKITPEIEKAKTAEFAPNAFASIPPPSYIQPQNLIREQPQIPQINQDTTTPKTAVAPEILSAQRITNEEAKELSSKPLSVKIRQVAKLVTEAGERHGVDPALSMAVVSAESSFNPSAVSSDGFESKGLFQLLDSTGKTLLERADEPTTGYDPFDPDKNVDLGVGYLRYLHEVFNKPTPLGRNLTTVPAASSAQLEKFAVAAFNAGEGRVAYAQSQAQRRGKDPSNFENVNPYLPEITQRYVQKVLFERDEFGHKLLPPTEED